MGNAPARCAGALLSIITLSLSACSSSSPSAPGSGLVRSWEATSFLGMGMDFIADGMDLTVTFTNSGTYSQDVTNDLIGTCGDSGPNCTTGGTYTATATQVTFDPGSDDETTFDYTIQGTTLTLTGNIEETPVTIVLSRV